MWVGGDHGCFGCQDDIRPLHAWPQEATDTNVRKIMQLESPSLLIAPGCTCTWDLICLFVTFSEIYLWLYDLDPCTCMQDGEAAQARP